MRIYGMKVIVLPREVSRTCGRDFFSEARSKANREKSAEAKVPDYEIVWEGPNHEVRQ
jgi:hypothetical protein